MPAPTQDTGLLRPDLALSLEEYDAAAAQSGYIALRVLPVFESALAGATFGRIPIEALLQNPEVDRTPRGGYNRGDWKFEDDTFSTRERGWEEAIDEDEAAIQRRYFDVERIATIRARGIILRAAEIRAAAALFNATTFSAHPVTNEWDDLENAVPIDDVEASVRRVWAACGLWPNALIVDRLVFRNLRRCKQILDRIAAHGAGSPIKATDVTAAMLAEVFDLEEIIIAGSPKNTANPNKPVQIASIWSGEYAMTARVGRTEDLREPCVGRTIHWDGGGSQIGGAIESYYSPEVRGDVIRCRHRVHEKIIYAESADLLSNITT
jgi:hypothetical protein